MNQIKIYAHKIIFLIGNGKRKVPLLIVFFLISSILDLIGIGMIIPFVSLIISPEGVITEKLYTILSFFGFDISYKNLVLLVGLSLLVLFSLKAFTAILVNKKILYFCFSQGIYIRTFLMKSYQDLPYIDFLQRNSSEYIYNIQHVVELYYREVLQSFLKLISELLVFFFIVLLLIWYDPKALGLLLILVFGSIYLFDLIFKRNLGLYGEQINHYSVKMVKAIAEGIDGLKEIRILNKEAFFYKIVEESAKKHAKASTSSEIISNLPRYFLEAVLIYFVVILSFIAILSNNSIDTILPTISLFAVASLRLSPSANSIINSISRIRIGKNSVDLLYKDMKLLKAFNFKDSHIVEELIPEKFSSLELFSVNFSFPNSKRRALNNISIKINSGEAIGIMGSSGSGKSTLIDLMLGLLEPESGKIYFNEKPINKKYRDLKSQIAYLPQQVFIIDDTIANNIALGVDSNKIDLQKLNMSINKAQLTQAINEMAEGIDTILGEKGVRLSGGERQRISLARAFYHDKNILIMDESTSALDTAVESQIVEEVMTLKKDKTLVLIAHRLSTLKHCDCIYQIENGNIIRFGSYEKMVLKNI